MASRGRRLARNKNTSRNQTLLSRFSDDDNQNTEKEQHFHVKSSKNKAAGFLWFKKFWRQEVKITGDVSEVILSQRSCLVSITYSRESCVVVSEESLFTEGAGGDKPV